MTIFKGKKCYYLEISHWTHMSPMPTATPPHCNNLSSLIVSWDLVLHCFTNEVLRIRQVEKFAQGHTACNEKPWFLLSPGFFLCHSGLWRLWLKSSQPLGSHLPSPTLGSISKCAQWLAGQASEKAQAQAQCLRRLLRACFLRRASHGCTGLICIKVSLTIFGLGEGICYF